MMSVMITRILYTANPVLCTCRIQYDTKDEINVD